MKFSGFILIVIILSSCRDIDHSSEPNEYAARFVKELNNSDTFRYELPLRMDTRTGEIDSFTYFSKLNVEKRLGLESLEKGFDSIQIRISSGSSLQSEWMMLILTQQNKKWSAEVSKVKNHFNSTTETIDFASRIYKYDSPKSGWVNFITKLFDLKILSINHESIIPLKEYTSPSDGCSIEFEIATKNVYRIYGYNNPEMQSKEFWQVNNVLAIQKLLQDEFAVYKLWSEKIETDWTKGIEDFRKKEKNSGEKIEVKEVFLNYIDSDSRKKN